MTALDVVDEVVKKLAPHFDNQMIMLSNGVILHNTLNETDVFPLIKYCREGGLLVEVACFSKWDAYVVFRVAKEVFIIVQTALLDEELTPIFQEIYDKYTLRWDKIFPRKYKAMGDLLKGVIFSLIIGVKPEPLAWSPKNLMDSIYFDFSDISIVLLTEEMGESYQGALFQRPFLKHGYLGLFYLFGISDPKSTSVQYPCGFSILMEYTNRLIVYELFPQIESICQRYAQNFRLCWQNKKDCQNTLREMYKVLSSIPLRSSVLTENIKNMMINSVQELNHIQKDSSPQENEEEGDDKNIIARIRENSLNTSQDNVAVNVTPIKTQNRFKQIIANLSLKKFQRWRLQQDMIKGFNSLHQPKALSKALTSILRTYAFESFDTFSDEALKIRIMQLKFGIDRVKNILIELHHFSEQELKDFWWEILDEYLRILPKMTSIARSQIEMVLAPLYPRGVFLLYCHCAYHKIIGSSKTRPYMEKLSTFLKDLPDKKNPPDLENIIRDPMFQNQVLIISLPVMIPSKMAIPNRWETHIVNLKYLAQVINLRNDFKNKIQGQEIPLEDLETSFHPMMKDQSFKIVLTRLNQRGLLSKPIDFTNTGIIITKNSWYEIPKWLTVILGIVGPILGIIWWIIRAFPPP